MTAGVERAGLIRVRVMLFAQMREACGGVGEVDLELPSGSDVAACFEALVSRYPEGERLKPYLVVAVNERYAGWDRAVGDGDTVVFVPPVSGGSARGPAFRVTPDAVSGEIVRRIVAADRAGAIVTFVGVVRDHHRGRPVRHLEYEAYAPMAEATFEEIADEARSRWQVESVAVHHRVGRLDVGEASVAIAVSAPHRSDAFEACRYVLDGLKERAPIWKRESGPDGSWWVEGPDAPAPARTGS
jgi:molybdopterin synthase catalytic subunit